MNLLKEQWMPVCCKDGSREWVNPERLSDPNIVAFDADRPDFNGALAQFAIGLLQTTTPVDSSAEWKRLFESPPDSSVLQRWFESVSKAFHFDGNDARFMQDRSLKPSEGAVSDIGALLIESPGENTLKNNGDHFIKRGQVSALCPHCAVTALLTLQINAPAGGAGHRTGLRGGGPLTTLVLSHPQRSLWHDLWLNVCERSKFLAECGSGANTAEYFSFPWLADISRIQKEGSETASAQVHPSHVFWAMPRRIRLDFDEVESGDCDICGRFSERLVRRYVTKNYGLNYKGEWEHPLSPYYETKEGWLPLHPQPGGFGYRHWLAWSLGVSTDKKKVRRARTVEYVMTQRHRQIPGQLCLWAFGYDMDNMKARCWYESTLPLYGLADCENDAQKRVESEVAIWLAGADMAAFYLRSAVRDAWFSADARGDFSFIDASFWSRTEAAFYRQLADLIKLARTNGELVTLDVREVWHRLLIKVVRDLFDEVFVGAGQVERQNPRRIASAYQQLERTVSGAKMRQALGLSSSAQDKPKASKKTVNDIT